jgi:hypothetical protein
MNTPELTWRLRRIGTTLWPSLYARKGRAWLDTAAAAIRTNAVSVRGRTSDRWLAALREHTT